MRTNLVLCLAFLSWGSATDALYRSPLPWLDWALAAAFALGAVVYAFKLDREGAR